MRDWFEDVVGAVALFVMVYALFFLGYGLGF